MTVTNEWPGEVPTGYEVRTVSIGQELSLDMYEAVERMAYTALPGAEQIETTASAAERIKLVVEEINAFVLEQGGDPTKMWHLDHNNLRISFLAQVEEDDSYVGIADATDGTNEAGETETVQEPEVSGTEERRELLEDGK